MKIDPRHLIQFATIIEERSFTSAAGVLGVSQPALSKTVAYLEDRLGQKLLLSRRRPVEPTELGRELAQRGIQMRSIVEDAGQTADMVAQGRYGTLRIGAPPFFCEDVLAQLVIGFRRDNPSVWFEIVSAYAPELRGRVAERKLDIALVPLESMAPDSGLIQDHFADVMHAIVARTEYRIDATAPLMDVLARSLWIGHAHKSILHGYAQNALARMGITRLRSFASSESGAALISMLRSVDSLAVLPILTALPHLRSGALKIVAVPHELPVVPIGVVVHETTADERLIAAFRSFAKLAFARLEADAKDQIRTAVRA